jgi:hypothetical protein
VASEASLAWLKDLLPAADAHFDLGRLARDERDRHRARAQAFEDRYSVVSFVRASSSSARATACFSSLV